MEITADYLTVSDGPVPANSDRLMSVATAVLGMTTFSFGGPGAAIAAQQGYLIGNMVPVPASVRRVTLEQSATVNAGETLKIIREAFGFNVTELAEVFGKTRPTIYSWLKGTSEANRDVHEKLQTLSAAAAAWVKITSGADVSYLLDYKGPKAADVSIRDTMKGTNLNIEILETLMATRVQEYKKASAETREMIGAAPAMPEKEIPQGSRKLNKLWTQNAHRIHSNLKSEG